MVVQSAAQAEANANRFTQCDPGMCLRYTRTWLEIPSREPDAITAWRNARRKHEGDRNPPRGAPVFWSGSRHGHIALSIVKADERMRGTDMPSRGRVTNDTIRFPEQRWGQHYLGWTEDLNGVSIPYLTGGGTAPPNPEDEDMPLTDADVNRIAAAVWARQVGTQGQATSVGTIMVRLNPGTSGIAAHIRDAVWSHRLGGESVGTIMQRINPGTSGILAGVRDAVWARETTDTVDGSLTNVLQQLRFARGDARRAANR